MEFPIHIVTSYHGVDNLDVTLDDNISYLNGKYFLDHQIGFEIVNQEFDKPIPNVQDELLRYEVDIDVEESLFRIEWVRDPLIDEGFDRGLTIRVPSGNVLFADRETADISLRRIKK